MNDKGCITVGVRLADFLRREMGVTSGQKEVTLSTEQLALVLAVGVREGWLRRQEALGPKSHVPGRVLVSEAPPAGASPCLLVAALRASMHAPTKDTKPVEAHGEMVPVSGPRPEDTSA